MDSEELVTTSAFTLCLVNISNKFSQPTLIRFQNSISSGIVPSYRKGCPATGISFTDYKITFHSKLDQKLCLYVI